MVAWRSRRIGCAGVLPVAVLCGAHAQEEGASFFEPYDCTIDFDQWETKWEDDKITWCCAAKDVACVADDAYGAAAASESPTDDANKFNCQEDLAGWRMSWSTIKQDWCCEHHLLGCRNGLGSAPAAAGAAGACDTHCVFDNQNHTCADRVVWASKNVFQVNDELMACEMALDLVQEQCPTTCGACVLSTMQCGPTTVPPPTLPPTTLPPCTTAAPTVAPTTAEPTVAQAARVAPPTPAPPTPAPGSGVEILASPFMTAPTPAPTHGTTAPPTPSPPTPPPAPSLMALAPVSYDCTESEKDSWDVEERRWCCYNMNRGCKTETHTTTPEPDPYTCEGHPKEWPQLEKLWCCHYRKKCVDDDAKQPEEAASAVASKGSAESPFQQPTTTSRQEEDVSSELLHPGGSPAESHLAPSARGQHDQADASASSSFQARKSTAPPTAGPPAVLKPPVVVPPAPVIPVAQAPFALTPAPPPLTAAPPTVAPPVAPVVPQVPMPLTPPPPPVVHLAVPGVTSVQAAAAEAAQLIIPVAASASAQATARAKATASAQAADVAPRRPAPPQAIVVPQAQPQSSASQADSRLDGHWVDKRGNKMLIQDTKVTWPANGRTADLRIHGDSLTMAFAGSDYHAELVDGKLKWDVDDVWSRESPLDSGTESSKAGQASAAPATNEASSHVRAVLDTVDSNGDGHLDFTEINLLQKAAQLGAISDETYQQMCRQFHEDPQKGLGVETLTSIYSKHGTTPSTRALRDAARKFLADSSPSSALQAESRVQIIPQHVLVSLSIVGGLALVVSMKFRFRQGSESSSYHVLPIQRHLDIGA